ncbi:MAG: alginate export family protein [Candidatus Solibacter usitatus]|nr:alginate export family protein [Candidatus Solibacter usitatus]
MRTYQSAVLAACLTLSAELAQAQAGSGAPPAGARAPWTPAALSEKTHDQWKWLRVAGELRSRAETPTALNFMESRDDADVLTRLRLNALVTPRPWLRFFGEWQDVRAFGYNPPVPGTVANRMDLRQAYVEAGAAEGAGLGLRVGRQALKYGKGRLVWDPDWANFGRTFDAVRLTAAGRGARLDVFAASVLAPQDRRFDRSDTSNMLYGAYGSLERWGKRLRIEPYLFVKSNAIARNELGGAGALDLYSPGFRGAGLLSGSVDWEAEMVFQAGRLTARPVRAFGGVWVLGWQSGARRWQPRLSASYTYASGDGDPRDGRKGTFDTLYPTTHLRNGATDRIGWANIHDVLLQSDWKPSRKLKVSAGAHDFRLATTQDALYGPGGAALVRNARASSGHVGFELSGTADYALSRTLSLGAGYAHLFRGAFLRESGRGGATQPYVFLTYRF